MRFVADCLLQIVKLVISFAVILALAVLGFALLTANGADLVGRLVGLVLIVYCGIFSPAFLFYYMVMEPRQRWPGRR